MLDPLVLEPVVAPEAMQSSQATIRCRSLALGCVLPRGMAPSEIALAKRLALVVTVCSDQVPWHEEQ